MNLTRNTKLYKATSENGNEVIYRNLTVNELKSLDNIISVFYKNKLAFDIASIDVTVELNYFEIQQIGKDIINNSLRLFSNPSLFELTIDEFRATIDDDPILSLIATIINVLPNTSIQFLLTQTYDDLIELGVLCEKLSNKKIFNVNNSASKSNGPLEIKNNRIYFKEDGKSLQDKMKEMEHEF